MEELLPDEELCQRLGKEMLAIKCSAILEDVVESHIESIWKTIEMLKRQKERLARVINSLVENNLKALLEAVLCLLERDKERLVTLVGPSLQNVRHLLSVFWIGTDSSPLLCHQFVCSSTMVPQTSQLLEFLNNAPSSQSVLFVIKFILGCWHNCFRHVSLAARTHFKEFDLKSILQNTVRKFDEHQMILAKGIIVLSYLLTDEEKNDKILENKVLGFIVQILRQAVTSEDRVSRRHGMSVNEVLHGINNLSINDNNKEQLVRSGALPIFVDIMRSRRDEDEVLQTLMVIWRISFLDQIFPSILSEPDLIHGLYTISFVHLSNKPLKFYFTFYNIP